MEDSLLKKRKEKEGSIKVKVSPLTMCQIFFREGYVLNNSKILGEYIKDFTIGKGFTFNFVNEHDLINVVFKTGIDQITNTWTVYKKGEYATIIKTK